MKIDIPLLIIMLPAIGGGILLIIASIFEKR
jgi:hypothetical protein